MGRKRGQAASKHVRHITEQPTKTAGRGPYLTGQLPVRPDLSAALCDQCIALIWEGLIKQPGEGDDENDFRFQLEYWLDRDCALMCQICSRAQAEFRKYSIDVSAIMDWSWYCIKEKTHSNKKPMKVHLGLRYRGLDYGWPTWQKPEDRTPEASTICWFNVWPTIHDAVDRMLPRLQLDPPRRPVVISWGYDEKDDGPREVLPDMGIIKPWLETCNANHASCLPTATNRTQSWIPDRLILCVANDGQHRFRIVRKSSNSDMAVLRSLHTDGEMPYVALSYCWGPPVFAQAPQGGRTVLTEARFKAWTKDIPVQSLGKTLVHALKLTIKLGYKLIWIDSLCIVQDSFTDWTTQSGQMSEVYQNSSLVVAALSAKSVEDGLFQRSKVLPVSKGFQCDVARWLQCQADKGSNLADAKALNGESFEREWRISLVWNTQLTVWSQLWPLQSRAWAFQEYQMARRVLAIHSAGYFCHCQEDNICSTLNVPALKVGALHKYFARCSRKESAIGARDVLEDFGKFWQTVVREYSETSLTFQTDRLLAVSAIAKALAMQGGYGHYLAGLWEVHGCRGLTWSGTMCSPRRHYGSEEYIAPSWSWLSVPGSVGYHAFTYPTRLDLCQLISHGIKSKTQFAFGQIEAGYLRVQGHLETLVWNESRMQGARPNEWHCIASGMLVKISPDTTEDETNFKSDLASLRWLPVASYIQDMGEIEIVGLLVLEAEATAYTTPFGQLEEGLKVYRRVGHCEGSIHVFETDHVPLADRIFQHAEGLGMEHFFADMIERDVWDSDEWPEHASHLQCQTRDTVDLILV